ncbi:MAG: hypothetical protein WCL51_17925 [Bacteroidota bacterium]
MKFNPIASFKKNKKLRITIYVLFILYAIIGFVLTTSFFAIKLHLFNDPGAVDFNDRYFQKNGEKDYTKLEKDTNQTAIDKAALLYYKLKVLNEYYPQNAKLIHDSWMQHKDIVLAEKMFDAVNLRLQDNQAFQEKLKATPESLSQNVKSSNANKSVFEWMNIVEWEDFKLSVVKDSALIDSAAKVTHVEPRLIVSVLLGEQMRLFNSTREVYKKVISPLKILSVEAKFSMGVTGIKEETSLKVERFLKDSLSPFYLGKEYNHLLDFYSSDPNKERYTRLINYRNHFYSYLYAAIILRQVREQWRKAGFDISNRPEILATLYNVGFEWSKPGPAPKVGGSHVTINERVYTFGALAYEFYYSGELLREFPFKPKYW